MILSNKSFTTIIAVQGLVIAALMVDRAMPRHAPICEEARIHTVVRQDSPLWLALRYESPLEKFSALAREHPDWINLKSKYDWIDEIESNSILSECAIRGLTNHVQILLTHGAEAEEAIEWNENYGWQEAADLIKALLQDVEASKRR